MKYAPKVGSFFKTLTAGLLEAHASANLATTGLSAYESVVKELAKITKLPVASLSSLIPMLTALTVTIAGAVIGIDALTVSGKEAAKASDEAAQSFEDSANKVSGIKKELQDVNDKIDEINKQDKISPTDDANLQKLKTQKELLERDLAIEQTLYKLRQKQNAEQAANAIAQNGSESMDWRHVTDNDLSRLGVTEEDRKRAGWKSTVDVADDTGDLSTRWEYDLAQETAAMQSAYNRYVQQQNELKQQLADNGSLTKEQEKQKKQIDEYTQKLEEAIGQNVEELQTYRERLTNSSGQALKGREDQVFQIDQVLDQYSGIERDPFEDLANHWKELQRLSQTDAGMQTAEMRHFLEVMSGKDLSTAGLEDLQKTWDKFKNLQTVDFSKMFTGDAQTNLQNFWKMVEKVNSEWAEFDEKTQTWKFNIDSVEELAKKLGISEDLVKNIIKLTNEAGAKIEVQNKDLNGQKVMDSSKAEKTLKKAGIIDKKYNVNLEIEDSSQLLQQIGDITSAIDAFSKKHGKINIDTKDGQAAYSLISQLYDKLIELSNKNNIAFHLNTEEIGEGGTKAQETAKSLHDATAAIVEYQAALLKSEYNPKINVEEFEKKAKEACDAAAADLKALETESPDLAKALSINADDLDFSAISAKLGAAVDPNVVLEQIRQSIAGMTQDDFAITLGVKPEAIENYVAEEKETPVALKVDDSALKTVVDKTYDVSTKIKVTDKSALTGLTTTVSATLKPFKSPLLGLNDFQGNAHAGGKWGAPRNEVALTSELGPEIVVDPKTGRWQTVGDKGAQFTRLPKGAIVFNHKQTEQLLKYGHINSRGKALIGGNAYPTGVQGTWNVGGTNDSDNGSKEQKDAAKETTKTAKEVAKNVKDSTDASKTAADTLKEETSNLTDWVEKVLENIDKKTEKYLAKAEKKAEAGNYTGAAKQYQKALNTYDKSIGKHGDAENLYMRQANSALSKAISSGTITKEMAATIQKRVANGAMDISKLSDGTKAVVDAYKEYYDKAVAAQDATQELYDKYEETAKKMYQLPLDQASAKTDKLKNSYDLLEKKLDLTTNTTKQAAIIEKQMENVRKQHVASTRAAATAESNFAKAQREAGKSLSGLSEALKEQVQEQLAKGLQIDITSLTGLTADGKQAILDYNAALAAQTDAMQAVRLSALETNAALLELAANKANKPNEKADATVAKLETADALIDAQLDATDNLDDTLELLGKKSSNSNKRLKAREDALDTLLEDMYTAAEDDVVSKILDAQKKNVGQKVNLKASGLPTDSEEYKKLVDYNAAVDAYNTADYNYQLAAAKEAKERSDIALATIQAVGDDADYGIAKQELKRDNIQAGIDNLGTYLNKIAANPEMAQLLASEFYNKYGWNIDPAKGYAENQQIGYDELATANNTIASLYDDKATDMAAQFEKVKGDILDGEAAEQMIREAREAGAKAELDASDAIKNRDTAADTASQTSMRELERQYNDAQDKIASDKASEKFISNSDYQHVLDILWGWVDAEGEAQQGLIAMQEAYVKSLQDQRDALVEGTPEWQDLDEKVSAAADKLAELKDAAEAAKDAMTANDEKGFEDALALNAHNGNMIDARKRKNSAIGSAIGNLVGGGNFGEAIGAMLEMGAVAIMGGAAVGSAFSKAVNDPNGFSFSNLLSYLGEGLTTVATTQTTMGNLQEAGGIYGDQVTYYQNKLNDPNITDEERDEFTQKLREAQENKANNEADQEEEKNKSSGGGGGGSSGEFDWWQRIYEILQRYYVKQLHVLTVIESHIKNIKRDMQRAELEGRDVDPNSYVELAKEQKAWNHQLQTKVIPAARNLYRHQKANTDDKTGEAAESAWKQWQQHQEELKDGELEILKIVRQGLRDSVLAPLEHLRDLSKYALDAIDGISGLITDRMRYTKDDKLSQWGQYQNDMYVGQFRAAQEAIQGYVQEIQTVSALAHAGLYTGDEAREKIADAHNEIVRLMSEQESAAQSLADTMEELGQKELDSLHDLIDARKEALQSKKDYYDYDKNIRSQTKDIQALEAQIAALEGLTDAESKAKRAKLEEQLAEAQEKLDDTVREHEFSLAEDSLDKLAETLDEAFEEQWDTVTTDLHELLAYAEQIAQKTDNKQIAENMQNVLREFGIKYDDLGRDLSQFGIIMRNAVEDSTDGMVDTQVFDKAQNDLLDALKKLQQEGLIDKSVDIDSLRDPYGTASAAGERVENRDTTNTVETDTKPQTYKEAWNQTVHSKYDLGLEMTDDLSSWEKWQNTLGAYSDANLKPGVHLLMTNFMTELALAVPTAFFDLIGSFVPSVSKWWDKTLYGGLLDSLENGWLSKMRKSNNPLEHAEPVGSTNEPKKTLFEGLFGSVSSWFKKGKASGTRRISSNDLYWTQEGKKEEWIVRPSDGAILTPLSKGDGVLPADITSKLWALAEGRMPQMQMPKLQLPDYNIVENYSPNINIDSSIHVEGSVDAAVISDLKKFRDDMCEDAYKYTSEKMYRGYMHSGGKRRI